MSVCLFVCLGISCIRKSQAISTKLGMEAQNLKCEVELMYKSDINFRLYTVKLDFGLLQHWPVSIFLKLQ
jgi:hypothetical protein